MSARLRAFALGLGIAIGAVGAPAASAAFELRDVRGGLTDPVTGQAKLQAGAHADLHVSFRLPERATADGSLTPDGAARTVETTLPLGLVGNPNAFPQCSRELLASRANGTVAGCSVGSQVGLARVKLWPFEGSYWQVPVYNLDRPVDAPGEFGVNVLGAIIRLVPGVSGGDYAITVDSRDISQAKQFYGLDLDMWGVPADSIHDPERFDYTLGDFGEWGVASPEPRVPFLTNPTSCVGTPLEVALRASTWENPGDFVHGAFSRGADGQPLVMAGCERLPFAPTIEVKASATRADAPTGLSVRIDVPQNDAPDGLATAHVKDVTMVLPDGMAVSPSSAAGLGACAQASVGLGSNAPHACPPSSKLGTVEIDTPLLADPLAGDVILAEQQRNPFGTLLALYLVAEGPGFTIKLPGRIDTDPATGRLTATFANNPQLPFSTLRVRFDDGPKAALATPTACGIYTTTAEVSSWSGKTVSVSSPMTIDQGCEPRGFAPSFTAGSASAKAGEDSTFTLSVARPDGQQELKAIETVRLPEGLLGRVGSVPLCAEADAQRGVCPAGSRVGSTTVAAGAGASPLWIAQPGKAPTSVSLTGPYGGAPFGLSIVVPAQAGPFDLGTVVVRSALFVDRRDAHVTVVTDPLPHILSGIPLRMREVRVTLDRPGFMLNPTSCAPKTITGTLRSLVGQMARPAAHFQVGGCSSLPFAPKMAFKVGARGRTGRDRRTPLVVSLGMSPGQANNRSVEVTLPKALNARLDVVQRATACTIQQYDADACPNPVGTASAVTPLLRDPLRGSVYLVYTPDRKLPDLVARLKGQVNVDLVGRVTITRDLRLRTTFDTIPDVPITTFRMALASGERNGPVGITADLCRSVTRRGLQAGIVYRSQSNRSVAVSQQIKVAGCAKAKAGGGARSKRQASKRAAAKRTAAASRAEAGVAAASQAAFGR